MNSEKAVPQGTAFFRSGKRRQSAPLMRKSLRLSLANYSISITLPSQHANAATF